MQHLHTRLRAYVPTMIGLGLLILMGDGIVILLRLLGIAKWTAFYLAFLMVAVGVSVVFRRLQWRAVPIEQEAEKEAATGETS
ncbi:MAG: hypothetical protein KF716_25715 [Anaerolineae bacterium]|nr:hypothetical protein [Anaerolineae bacterium]